LTWYVDINDHSIMQDDTPKIDIVALLKRGDSNAEIGRTIGRSRERVRQIREQSGMRPWWLTTAIRRAVIASVIVDKVAEGKPVSVLVEVAARTLMKAERSYITDVLGTAVSRPAAIPPGWVHAVTHASTEPSAKSVKEFQRRIKRLGMVGRDVVLKKNQWRDTVITWFAAPWVLAGIPLPDIANAMRISPGDLVALRDRAIREPDAFPISIVEAVERGRATRSEHKHQDLVRFAERAKRLSQTMQWLGYAAKDVAEKTSLSYLSMHSIIKNDRPCKDDECRLIAQAMGVDEGWLLDGGPVPSGLPDDIMTRDMSPDIARSASKLRQMHIGPDLLRACHIAPVSWSKAMQGGSEARRCRRLVMEHLRIPFNPAVE
jgi:hypothetical protein